MTTCLCQLICWIHLSLSMAYVHVNSSYLSVGDNLKLDCVLNDQLLESYNAHNISFNVLHSYHMKLDALKPAEPSCLPMASAEVVNSTTALLTLPNVTSGDTGLYTCSVGGSNCPASQNNGSVGVIVYQEYITVDEIPQNVTDLKCVVNNWDESMVCQWQHPINYSHQDAIKVTSYYAFKYSSFQSGAYKCPQQSYTGCQWSLGEFMATLVLQVSVTNTRTARTATAIFVIDTNRIVKPAPVEQLTAVEDRARTGCINVSWTHARKPRPMVYRISHQIVGDARLSILSADTNDTHVVSCGHLPHTHHRFYVECLPTYIWSGYWSDPVFTEAWTSMTAPGRGPRTSNGSFTTTECTAGVRNVTLMWQEVERDQQNGVIDGYIIRQGETILQKVSEQNFWADVQLPCHSTSEISILAHNLAGYSIQPSVVVIPPVSFTVPQEVRDSFAVKITSNQTANQTDSVVATWDVSVASGNSTYTIFWCMSQSSQTCQGAISWMLVPDHQVELEVPLSAVLSTKYHFGISVTDPQSGLASSIHWTQCLFWDNPAHLPRVDPLKVEIREGMVLVSWDLQRCTYQPSARVSGYIVKWCLQSHCDELREAWVPATQSFYAVRGLEANVPYLLAVQAVGPGTAGDAVTTWIPVTMPGPGVPIWLFLVIGVFVGLPVLSCVLYVYRTCKRRGQAFEALRNKKMTDFLNITSLTTSPTEDVVFNNRLMQGPWHDRLLTPAPMTLETTSERRLQPPRPGMASAEAHHDGSVSDDSFGSDTFNNSRACLITGPARDKRGMSILTPSTSSAGVCNEAWTCISLPYVRCTEDVPRSTLQTEPALAGTIRDRDCSSITYVRCTEDVPRSTLQTEPALAGNLRDRDCSNRGTSEACPDFQECPKKSKSMTGSSMSFNDYSKVRDTWAQNSSPAQQELKCLSQESLPSDVKLPSQCAKSQSSHDLHTYVAISQDKSQSSHDLHTDVAFSQDKPQSSHDLHTDGAFSPGRRGHSPDRSSETVDSKIEQYVRLDDFGKLSEQS